MLYLSISQKSGKDLLELMEKQLGMWKQEQKFSCDKCKTKGGFEFWLRVFQTWFYQADRHLHHIAIRYV